MASKAPEGKSPGNDAVALADMALRKPTRDPTEPLRQLWAAAALSNTVPQEMLRRIFALLAESESASPRVRVLCALLVSSQGPIDGSSLEILQVPKDFGSPIDRRQIPLILSAMGAVASANQLRSHAMRLVKWSTNASRVAVDFDARLAALQLLHSLCLWHPRLVPTEPSANGRVAVLSSQLQSWLSRAGTTGYPRLPSAGGAPQSSGPAGALKKSAAQSTVVAGATVSAQAATATELDGRTSARDAFTVLNLVAEGLSLDQLLNVHGFSMLLAWLRRQHPLPHVDQATAPSSVGDDDAQSGGAPLDPALSGAVFDYCMRVLEQAEARVGTADTACKPIDRRLCEAVSVEAVRIVDHLCGLDASLIPRAFPAFRRMFSRLASEATLSSGSGTQARSGLSLAPPVAHPGGSSNGVGLPALALLRFFVAHGEQMAYDVGDVARSFFCDVLPSSLADPYVVDGVFEMLLPGRPMSPSLPALLAASLARRYFPVLMRAIAWHPRTLLREGASLFAVMFGGSEAAAGVDMRPAVNPEHDARGIVSDVVHCLLDLPAAAAYLELRKDFGEGAAASQGPSLSSGTPGGVGAQAVTISHAGAGPAQWPQVLRAADPYLSRCECAPAVQGDVPVFSPAVARSLDWLAGIRQAATPRACGAAFVAPALVHPLFAAIAGSGDASLAVQALAQCLVRVPTLFGMAGYRAAVCAAIASSVTLLFDAFPSLVSGLRRGIVDFVGQGRGSRDAQLVSRLVWVVGERASPQLDPACTADVVASYHEAIELFAYEINTELPAFCRLPSGQPKQDSSSEGDLTYTPALMCVVLSALAKLSSRCQDLMPRVLLCLTKVMKQHSRPDIASAPGAIARADSDGRPADVVRRARELWNVLQMPSVAAVVLGPSRASDALDSELSPLSVLLHATRVFIPPDGAYVTL